uniref:Uncharacterized protein n=1 Tax=Acrobeloides nanus TaxID=290746 RepID=A0A914E807_9BILA
MDSNSRIVLSLTKPLTTLIITIIMSLNFTVCSYLKFSVLSIILASSSALKCFQTNKETKETVIVENENFKFCSIFPSLVGSKHLVTSFSDGLTSEELDKPFEKLYEENDNIYKMLSVCLYEKYDWPKAINPKLHSVLKSPTVELTLRCVCNYDLCNSPSTFSTYTNQLEN